MISNLIEVKITKEMHIINDNVTKILADKVLQGNPTTVINNTSSIQMDIESRFIELNNSKTITPNKGRFCNKDAIKSLVKKIEPQRIDYRKRK